MKDGLVKAIMKYVMIQIPGKARKTHVNLSYCQTDDEVVARFVEEMLSDVLQQKINTLDLSNNLIGDESCKHLARLLAANF